jgi:hypothetical protein
MIVYIMGHIRTVECVCCMLYAMLQCVWEVVLCLYAYMYCICVYVWDSNVDAMKLFEPEFIAYLR